MDTIGNTLKDPKSVLIIGIAGGLAKITAGLLVKKFPGIKIIGVDSRKIADFLPIKNLQYKRIRYTRGQFEKLFRDHNFDLVLHLARMGHTQSSHSQLAARLDLNLIGTQRILELSLKFNVKKLVILSTYHVYGALNDNPVFLNEEAPLRASIKYPDLRDVVEMDQIASNWAWRYKEKMETIVLRPCSIIGPQINNSMTRYLKGSYMPLPIDFNPMFQFIHEFDMAHLIIENPMYCKS